MTPIALYPSDGSHKKSAAVGGAYIFIAYQISIWLPDVSGYVAHVIALFGIFLITRTAWRYLNPRPSFAANADGFSVMGSKKLCWDAYRGARVCTAKTSVIPIGKCVSIETGGSVPARDIQIKFTHLSGPAADMVDDIDIYARHAQRAEALTEALSAMPATPMVGDAQYLTGRRRADPMPTAIAAIKRSTTGPVPSVPSLSKRVFGRS